MGINSVSLLSSAPGFPVPLLYFIKMISSPDFFSLFPGPGCPYGERESCFAEELQVPRPKGTSPRPPPNSLFLYRLGKPRCLLCFSSVRTESRKSGTQQERAPAGQGQADPTLRGDRLWLWPGGCGQGSGAEAGTMPRTSLWKCTWVFQTLPGGVSTGRVKQWKISGPV